MDVLFFKFFNTGLLGVDMYSKYRLSSFFHDELIMGSFFLRLLMIVNPMFLLLYKGKNIEKYEPHTIVDLGIAQAPEGRRIFSRLTVEENLKLGAHANEKGKHFNTDIKEVYDLFPVLSDRKSQRGGTLSGGEQQMLAIGRALMNRPKVLLLDEPSLGIAPKLVNQIFLAIKNINKEKKVTIFLVEQNAKKALELADRAYVLVNGKVTIEGTGKELLKNQDIQAAYLEGGAKN